jgi:anaerobic selenocysteine-containing dehydrogenase
LSTTGIHRFCHAACGLQVTNENGRVTELVGDIEAYNLVGRPVPALAKRRPYNPAHMNRGDAARLGVSEGDRGQIASAAGSVEAIAHPAGDIRAGWLRWPMASLTRPRPAHSSTTPGISVRSADCHA